MKTLIQKMEWVEKYLSVFLFLTMLLVITTQIVSRYFLSIAIPWTEELSRWLYIYIVFVGGSEAISRRDHIAVDILQNRLSERPKLVLDAIIHIVFAAVCLVVIYYGWTFTERMDRLSSVTMDVKMSALYAAVPFGFTLVFIKSVINALMSVSDIIQLQKESKHLAQQSYK